MRKLLPPGKRDLLDSIARISESRGKIAQKADQGQVGGSERGTVGGGQ